MQYDVQIREMGNPGDAGARWVPVDSDTPEQAGRLALKFVRDRGYGLGETRVRVHIGLEPVLEYTES